MQSSPFDLVKRMASLFRMYSQFGGGTGKCVRFLSSVTSANSNRQAGGGGDGRTRRPLHGSSENFSYNCPFREGSLFAFAASSSVIWPVGGSGGNNGQISALSAGGQIQQRRHLWGWLNSIFNRVDESRIKEVGPDRACAEWLLRCGAAVKWDKGPDDWLRDYSSLPAGNYRGLRIVEIDATDSAVMHIGFLHFRGLKNVRKAIFHKCGYMEDEALRQLGFLKETLEELQISSCGNVTDEGILTLVQMKNLRKLNLYDFLEVRNRKNCIAVLQKSLPNCEIHFPFARESDRDPPAPDKAQEKV